MTHNPADVQAFIDAFDYNAQHRADNLSIGSYERLKAARERLRPKPEMKKVLPDDMPEWFKKWVFGVASIQASGTVESEAFHTDAWQELVTLTMREKKQKWAMPDWKLLQTEPMVNSTSQEPHLRIGNPNQTYLYCSEILYNNIRAKILSMNEETP